MIRGHMLRTLRPFSRAISLGLACAMALAPPARAETLADTLVSAYNNSGVLEQQRALLRVADEDVALAVSALRPILNWTMSASRIINQRPGFFGVSTTHTTTGFIGLALDWVAYAGGSNRLSVDAAKESVLATRETLVSYEQDVLLRAVTAYMGVIRTQENLSLRQNNLRVLEQERQAAQDRFDVGEVTRTDVALAESRVAEARSNLSLARGQLIAAQAEYITAVGRRPGNQLPFPKMPAPPASLDQATAIGVRSHPAIRAVQHQVSAAELGIKIASAAFGPTIGLRAEVGKREYYGSTNFNDDLSVTLNYNQTIYAGGALPAAVRRSMAGRDSIRASLLNTQKDVVQAVNRAYVGRETSRASLSATQERVAAARIAFEGIREEATLGARTTLDVLVAEQELLDAEAARILAQTEEYIAAYQLLAAQGLLTAEQLGLNVQIYDPTIYYNLAKDAPASITKQSRDLNRVLEALGKR